MKPTTRKRPAYWQYRWTDLATYNAERARGLRHTPEYEEKMRLEQEAFDAEMRGDATP